MEFSDTILLELATAAGRGALLDQAALGQMISAAFDLSVAPVQGPFSLTVETLDLGLDITRPGLIEGSFSATPGSVPANIRIRVEGLAFAPPPRVDALWRGTLIARRVPQDDMVAGVSGGFILLDLDRAIVAELGALPATPAALETARRRVLLARLRDGAAQPGALNDAAVDHMLAAAGVADASGLLAGRGTAELGAFRLAFTAAAVAPPVPVTLPVTVAVLVREAPLRLSALLAESRSIRAALADDPSVQPAPAPIRRRVPVLLLWVIPGALLDDAGWPGADRAARRSAAADLLSGQGIALATA